MSQEAPVAPEASPGGEVLAKRKNLRQVAGFLAVGLFNTVLTGPGTIWLQTMPMASFVNALLPHIPRGNA